MEPVEIAITCHSEPPSSTADLTHDIGPPSFRPMDFGQIIPLMRTEAGEITFKGRM
ncbi:MAG TPA: hypothetical protein PLU87_18860 [Sedimentisphaerales bacterium]|nr:hypothetical protein [Sedimentisphaerales bacterium]HRS13126.1 hypothetical protein [Sedimentisphaerales bacterium]